MKSILVLATFIAAFLASSYKMKIRSTGVVIGRLIKYMEERKLRIAGSEPILDYYDDYYVGDVTIGTPGQSFALALDTRSSDLWVVDSTCQTKICDGFLGGHRIYNRRKFDATRSSTLSRENITILVLYGSGWFDGPLLKDTVSFAGAAIEKQVFLSAEDIAEIFGYMRFDGILGLAWPALSMNNVSSPMKNLLPSLDAPIFTIWLDTKLHMSIGGNDGLITYGAVDNTNCHSDINYVPLTSETYWKYSIDGFSIGSFSQKRTETVISDVSTAWIGAPFFIMSEVVTQTGAQYVSQQQIYTVNCSTMMTQPNLEFTINGVKYNVPSKEYVVDLETGDGKCALAFFNLEFGDLGYTWILGAPWIRTYCNIFDFGQSRIGFAKSKHSES